MSDRETIRKDVRSAIGRVLDVIEEHDLAMFYSMEPDPDLGTIAVSWMLHTNKAEARKVVAALPGDWYVHVGSTSREPVLAYERDGIAVTLWCPPDTVRLTVNLPETED